MDPTNPNFIRNLLQLYDLMIVYGDQEPEPQTSNLVPASAFTAVPPASVSGLPAKICNFCRRNGETSAVYMGHNLRENGKVACPILRKHMCELCGATGDNAHTRSYCLEAAAQRSLQHNSPEGHRYHNSVVLKQTGRNSFGRRNTSRRHHQH